jgi:hypothetical protein
MLLSQIYTREKNFRFFPKKILRLATLQKFAPKKNHWPKTLFSGLGYHSHNGTPNTMSDQIPQKKNPNLILFGNGVQFYLEHSSRLDEYWRLGSIGVV